MQIKKDIILRFGIFYILVAIISTLVIGKIVALQFFDSSNLKAKIKKDASTLITIEANRGDILASDMRKLACSVPSYRIHFDTRAQGLTSDVFNQNIDSLALCLSKFFNDQPASVYRKKLLQARANGKRYFRVNSRRITYTELQKVKEFPLFRLGANLGGFIPQKFEERKLPFGVLASRTIGSLNIDKRGIFGIENAYHNELKGDTGVAKKTRVSGTYLKEVEVEPVDGHDLITTIDIDLQDVAENALLRQLTAHDAHHGSVILMEVATGEVKAIANLGKTKDGSYGEVYNYAIGEATEPGSTFKLASMIVALEDGFIRLTDTVDTHNGTYKYYDRIMRDSHQGGYGKITVKEVFEKSSNVGVSKLIVENYGKNPKRFVDRLYSMGLNSKLGITLKGEPKPRIKYPGDESWSGVTLPWMSIGYEIQQTPLQVLAFFNAIANNGKLMKPMFIKGIAHHGELIQEMEPVVLNHSICSIETIEKVHEMLLGVVKNGTAKNIYDERYQIAGKTGTSLIAKGTSGYKGEGGKSYQASFAGYFPADRPMYSCIIVVNGPSNDVYYANIVAGNVFKEISDRVYAQSYELPEVEQSLVYEYAEHLPYSKGGKKQELLKVFKDIGVTVNGSELKSTWISSVAQEHVVQVKEKIFQKGVVPNVKGLGAKDAVAVLENLGLKVVVNGYGRVTDQSIPMGTAYHKGATIYLKLS